MATGAAQIGRDVLLRFHKETGGGSWIHREGWAENADDLGSWFGVGVDGEGLVVQLELQGDIVAQYEARPHREGNNICGSIPAELGQLGSLRALTLHGNKLKLFGPIPPGLGQLAVLELLDLSLNNLEGTIPSQLGQLHALRKMRLWGNSLSGPIPRVLGGLVALTVLSLGSNMLTGSIPRDLGRLVALKSLYLGGNNLTGTIPPELGQLHSLETLSLTRNKLSGNQAHPCPSEMDGQIPPELGGLVALRILLLSRNELTGNLPPELGQLLDLEQLTLGSNNISGVIPPELGQLHALKQLSMGSNKFSGPIPPELGQLHALQQLSLARNNFSGTIPAELGQLHDLQQLSVWKNNLTGPIPRELGRLVALKILLLSRNELTGTIPPELGQLHALQELLLANNHLTGSIPSELHGLVALERLALAGNKLTGVVPKELGNIKTLARLDISGNKLTSLGEVEDALGIVNLFTMPRTGDARHLALERNPWIMPPEAIVEEGLVAIEAYLADVRAAKEAGAEVKTLQLLKVVLVGSSQAGKTSLMNSIIHEEGRPTKGTAEEVSTVGIELLRHRLGDVRVELYDCAGQIDYAGMRQIFLSRRALYLLVWDVKKCYGKHGDDLDQVIGENVMSWLYALHLRAPDATVVLVANKCDGPTDDFSETTLRVEKRIHELLKDWQDNRGIPGQAVPYPATLNLLPHISQVSCGNGWGLSQLIDRISGQGGTSISVPPAWSLALTVLDALRDQKAALGAARQHLNLPSSSQDRADGTPSFYFSKQALRGVWKGVLRSLLGSGELQSTAEKVTVSNPDSALEGALWISEFAGQVLRVDNGDGVFLDVVLLSRVLNPIFDHKLRHRQLPTAQLIGWREEVLLTGVLRGAFARHLWRDVFRDHAVQSPEDELEKALSDVLIKLGVAVPLGRTTGRALDGCALPTPHEGVGTRDMLVQRWAPLCLTNPEQEALDNLLEGRRQWGAREVMLKWMFDWAGPPQGLVGRLIASCHVIGEAEKGLCWKSGAVLKSPTMLREAGLGRLYVVEIRYTSEDRVLSIKISGPLEDERVWVALRFMASALVNISKEWQGMLWKGWVDCPNHARDHVYLATPTEARVDTPLIPDTGHGCDCLRDEGGELGLAVARLGNVIDTRSGDPFRFCQVSFHPEDDDGPRDDEYPPDTDRAPYSGDFRYIDDRASLRDPRCAYCGHVLETWRPHACRTAGLLFGSAFTLLVATFGLSEASVTMWVSYGLVVFLVIGAGVAAQFGYAQARAVQESNGGAHLVV